LPFIQEISSRKKSTVLLATFCEEYFAFIIATILLCGFPDIVLKTRLPSTILESEMPFCSIK
jgi:hypothetical protein